MWSADSERLLFVAPRQRPPGSSAGWLQPPDPSRTLYVANLIDPTPLAIGDTTVDMAAWREDGQILGLGRAGSNGALDIRLMDGAPAGQHVLELPLRPSAAYATAWGL